MFGDIELRDLQLEIEIGGQRRRRRQTAENDGKRSRHGKPF